MLLIIGSTVVGVCALAAVAHTPPVRHLFMRSGTCPLGFTGSPVSAADHDKSLQRAAQALRGDGPAGVKPALGFVLEQTSRQDVLTWAQQHQATCDGKPETHRLECKVTDIGSLPDSALEHAPGTLFLVFNSGDKLKRVQVMAHVAAVVDATRAMNAVLSKLTLHVGKPSHETGQPSTAYLEGGALRQAVTEYRYADFYAQVSVTNMGHLGYYSVSQMYQSLLD
ncbi:hypothetical protein [Novosphingobium sp.]|uniref:hypothetical protein n=1 Tax=Novosphingobium sp. TaxID=1874826 RepID=UPI003D0A3423